MIIQEKRLSEVLEFKANKSLVEGKELVRLYVIAKVAVKHSLPSGKIVLCDELMTFNITPDLEGQLKVGSKDIQVDVQTSDYTDKRTGKPATSHKIVGVLKK